MMTTAERSRRYRARKRRGVLAFCKIEVTHDDLERLDRLGLLPAVTDRTYWTDAEVAGAIHGALRRLAGLEEAIRVMREADR
jgi:hypothetical protein